MPAEIYGVDLSTPCRIVTVTAGFVGLEYEFKKVDLHSGKHMEPDFVKMNPYHNIPFFKDDNVSINESRAIACYIANEYDKTSKLYPKDNKTRAIIDQRLYFDMGTVNKAAMDIVYPVFKGDKTECPEKKDRLKEVLGWLNDMVKETGFIAGTSHITLADLVYVATYSSIRDCELVPLDEYKELNAWFTNCVGLIPNYEKVNGEGAKSFAQYYKSKL